MILTETVNVLESMRFLVTARRTLADICMATEMRNRRAAAQYFIDEASDYEVMHALVLGELPQEKYNQESEVMLFGILKQQLVENLDIIDENFANKFIAEINSLYPKYSTAKPVLEFQLVTEAPIGAGSQTITNDPAFMNDPTGSTGGWAGAMQRFQGKMRVWKQQLPSAKEMAAKFSQWATGPTGKAVGGAALAALLIYGGTKIYKRFFSQAARKCKGMSGADKTACMKQARANAIKQQIADIKAGSAVCSKSKNPEACRSGVNKKIEQLKGKVSKMAA